MYLKSMRSVSKSRPIVGARKERKTREDVRDYDLTIGEASKLVNRAETLLWQLTHQDIADTQMEDAPALEHAPPKTIQVVKLSKGDSETILVWKQTSDVRKVEQWYDKKMRDIPDFRVEWGDGEEWKTGRRAVRVFVVPQDIPDPTELHGWYAVFPVYDRVYLHDTHTILKEKQRHLHEDIFIAKMGDDQDCGGFGLMFRISPCQQ